MPAQYFDYLAAPYTDSSLATRALPAIAALRKLIFAFLLVFAGPNPYAQLLLIMLVSAAYLSYIVYLRPYRDIKLMYRDAALEVLLIFVYLLSVCLYGVNQTSTNSDSITNGLGAAIIGLVWALVAICLCSFIIETIKAA